MSSISSRSIASRLSRKISAATNAVFIAAILCVIAVSIATTRTNANGYADKALALSISEIEKILVDVESAADAMSWLMDIGRSSKDALSSITEQMLLTDTCMVSCALAFEPEMVEKGRQYYMPISYLDQKTNEIVTKVLGDEDYDYQTADWYMIPKLTGNPYWSEPNVDYGGSNRMIVSYSLPISSESGEFLGVLRSDVGLEFLTENVNKAKPYKRSFTLLVGRNGSFITHVNKEKILNETIFTDPIAKGNQRAISICQNIMNGETGHVNFKLGNRMEYATYAPLKNNWAAIMICSLDEMYKMTAYISYILMLIGLIGGLIIYRICKKTISSITMPITEFSFSAFNIGKGFFNAHIPSIDTNDEIRQLRDSLRYVQKTINQYITELKQTTASNERFESELNIASQIQQNMLLHKFPHEEDCDIYATLEPAKEVGGDLYDYVLKDDRILHFAIGDVSGKGVPAALFMAITKSSFRFFSGMNLGIAGVGTKINDSLCEGNESQMFVTIFFGKIDLNTLKMEFCNMGHNSVIIISPDGNARFLKAKANLAAALFEGFPYQGEELQLEKGSRILAYTDGVTEAEARDKSQYGEERLLAFASSLPKEATSQEVSEALLADVRKFTDNNEQNDDITIMTITL